MSFKLSIENKYGEQLTLTNSPNYVVEATGLSPVDSNIVTASVANYGGERYVSSRQNKRNIVLSIYVQEPVETNRINLYKYIRSHEFIRVYFKNNSRDVYIDGYVESFELNHFEQTQRAQVSIICPQPNFIDMESDEVTNGSSIKAFSFPFNTEVKRDSSDTQLVFSDMGKGTAIFTDFLATPLLTTLSGTPSISTPVSFIGMGELIEGEYFAKLSIVSCGRTRNIDIALGTQLDGANLIRGGESLVDNHNYIVDTVLTNEDGDLLTAETNNNILF